MEIPYAIVGLPGSQFIQVREKASGRIIQDVIEACAEEGWVRVAAVDDHGHYLIKGAEFQIVRKEMPIVLGLRADTPPAMVAVIDQALQPYRDWT